MPHARNLVIVALVLATGCASDPPTEHPYEIKSKNGVTDPEFQQTMGNLLGPLFVPGNAATTLVSAKQRGVLDPVFASEQIRIFEADLTKSDQIMYEEWANRPLHRKAVESFVTIFGWLM